MKKGSLCHPARNVLDSAFCAVCHPAWLLRSGEETAVRDNAVPAVLFCSVLIGATIWLPAVLLSWLSVLNDPDHASPDHVLYVQWPSSREHFYLFIKSALVGSSWSFAYFALKRLPVSIAGPIRSVGPAVTIVLATLLMHERPSFWQWIGILVVMIAFYAIATVGKREGIHFRKDRGVWLMVVGTILGALSGLYDKYLLQNLGLG